jgi:hypothetical protein
MTVQKFPSFEVALMYCGPSLAKVFHSMSKSIDRDSSIVRVRCASTGLHSTRFVRKDIHMLLFLSYKSCIRLCSLQQQDMVFRMVVGHGL